MKKKSVWLFFLFFLASALFGKEMLVFSFDTSKSVMEERLMELKRDLSLSGGSNLSIEKIGDRYAVVYPVHSLGEKERILFALVQKYPHIFSIQIEDPKLPQKIKPKRVPKQKQNVSFWEELQADFQRNLWEWGAIAVLGAVLLIIFIKEVADMIHVRRLQRHMRKEQIKMKNELNKEF